MRSAAVVLALALIAVPVAWGDADEAAYLAKIKPDDLGLGDRFGFALDVDGSTLIVGSPSNDSVAPDAGAVYVYKRVGGSIAQRQKLVASDGAAVDVFGSAVAVSGDVAIVGAWADDDRGQASGSAYVFARSDDVWAQRAKLVPSDLGLFDKFGIHVAASSDTVAVSSEDSNGAVYVFTRSGDEWPLAQRIDLDDALLFGHALDLQGDTLVIGSPSDEDARGAVYVFERTAGSWVQQARITASDADTADFFGISVALSGTTLVVGAPQDEELGVAAGSAYVFERVGPAWVETTKLLADEAAPYEYFGQSVAIAGNSLFVGSNADGGHGRDSGTVHVFERGAAAWTETARLIQPDGSAFDWFGQDIAVSGDTLLVGSYGDDEPWYFSGSAHALALPLDPPAVLVAVPTPTGDALAWPAPEETYGIELRYRIYALTGDARELLGETSSTTFVAPGCALGATCAYVVTTASPHAESTDSLVATVPGSRLA